MLKLLGWAVLIIFLIGLAVVLGIVDLIAAPSEKLTGTILERSLVQTEDGARQTARLKTPQGHVLRLDLGPPGGEGTIKPGEAVVFTAHPGRLQGRPVMVVDVILQRTLAAENYR